jgi:hypothetical protein
MGWIIIAVVVVALFGAMAYRSYRVNRFQQNAKVGDKCIFFINNDRYVGEIVSDKEESVSIYSMDGTYNRFRTDIYPL